MVSGTHISVGQIAREIARKLRKNPTRAEILLWEKIRYRKIKGYKFLRQHPLFYVLDDQKKFFIADFYCHKLKLIIEVDGPIHLKQKDYDRARSEILKLRNYNIVRFRNREIFDMVDQVLERLEREIEKIEEEGIS